MSLRHAILVLLVAAPCSEGELPNFPKRGQQQTLWCWAACGEMLTAWHAQLGAAIVERSQCAQVCRMVGGTSTCTCSECATGNACDVDAPACDQAAWPDLDWLGFDWDPYQPPHGLPLSLIRQDIEACRPFLFTLEDLEEEANGRLKATGVSHMRVGVGYQLATSGREQDAHVLVIDPEAINATCGTRDTLKWRHAGFRNPGRLERHTGTFHRIRPTGTPR